MSAPLKEVRVYVPESVHILLTARAQADGIELGAILKRLAVDWAKREAHAHRVAAKLFRNTGIEPDLFGESPDDTGESRNGRR